MNDEATGDNHKPTDSGGTDIGSMIGKLGQAERLVVFGAVILAVDYLLFELILREYFFGSVLLLVAGFVLAAVWTRHNRSDASWPLPYEWLMRVLGFTAGFLGVMELLDDIRFDILDESAAIIGGLALYVACFMMAWGAKQMNDTD